MRPRKKLTIPDPFAADLVRHDKERGLVSGFAVGEALGSRVDGMDRDTILRTHGRVVLPDLVRDLSNTAVALRVRQQLDGGEGLDAGGLDGGWSDVGDARRLVVAPMLLMGRPDDRGIGSAASGWARSLGGDAAVAEASAMVATVAEIARENDPFDPLSARHIITRVRRVVDSESATDGIEALIQLVRSSTAPSGCLEPFSGLPVSLQMAFTVTLALLIRPRAFKESVIFAANLGGPNALRGALTGAIAGAHRGRSCIPERWLGRVQPTDRN